MTVDSEQTGRAPRARWRRVAPLCALVIAAILVQAAPAMAGPLLLGQPELSRTGRTLVTSTGSWLPANNSYAYLWQRCGAGGCATVPGRTSSSYLLTTADIGQGIRSVVTATNGVLGTTSSGSDPTAPIVASPPLNMVPPALTGSGSTLTSTLGVWSDPSPASVAYSRRWQRCGGNGLSCQDVPGQSGATYALTSADADKFIRVVVSAEGLGARSVASSPLGPIMALIPPGSGGGGGGSGGGTGDPGKGGSLPPTGLRKLRPFPKVVVAGRLARGLTFISGLVVRRGPKGARVSVRCRGRGCPKGRYRGKLNRRGALRLRRFQRIYGPGATIEISITKPGAIGKFTRLRVRSRSVPSRRDGCLVPGASKFSRCP